jgi:uncharacterized protein (TIGR03435 family)
MGQLARFHRKSSSLVPLVVTVCWLAGSACQAQVSLPSATASAQERPVVFETASIRPSRDDEPFDQEFLRDGFLYKGGSALGLAWMAYCPESLVRGERVRNAPGWAGSEWVDVVAKVSTDDAAVWQRETALGWDSPAFKHALQVLLTERYKLVAHTIPVEEDGFALVLKNSVPNANLLPAGRAGKQDSGKPAPKDIPSIVVLPDWTTRFHDQPMSELASYLGNLSDFRIEDRTGLAGTYDFSLSDRLPVHPTDEEREDFRLPTERWDLERLGLKLVRAKVHTTALVIDHIERPSPN